MGKVSLFASIALLWQCSLSFAAAPSFGTFVGVLDHPLQKRQQLAKLELISSRENGNDLELIGILTLHFGGYRSGEYANYHFDRVLYQPLNSTRPLVFEQSDQEVTVVVDSFQSDEIKAKLRSNFSGGDLGNLVLRREKKVTPTMPILNRIGGDYTGECSSGKPWRLKVQTFRSTADTSRVGNPFSAYEMRAQLAEASDNSGCFFGATKGYCNKFLFSEGTYNFFKNELRLVGKTRTLKCSTTNDGLDCGSCKFRSMAKDEPGPSYEVPRADAVSEVLSPDPSSSPALATDISAIEGGYTGFLHHEYLDAYQPVSLSIVTYQAPVGGAATSLRMSAVASIYFGDSSSNEVIAYKFTERSYPNPLIAPHFVFKRSENDVDAVLQVTSIKDGEIKGSWNSILFGRVGSFTVRKDGALKLPSGKKQLRTLTGPYESSDWDLDLIVQLDRTPPNTDNPFFPLTLGGHFYHKDGVTPRIRVLGGSYNFYTGHIALEMGDKGRTISGRYSLDGNFRVDWTPAVTFTPFQEAPVIFRPRPEEEEAL